MPGVSFYDIPIIGIELPSKFELAINLRTAKDAWSNRATFVACPRRRGDRITGYFAAAHESTFGTKQTSNCRLPMSAFGGKADIGWTCSKMRLGNKLRLVYCRASPHPTRDRRRSSARNCRRLPVAVHGSAPELASAGVAAHLASVVHRAIRTTLGAPKSCRRILAQLVASQA